MMKRYVLLWVCLAITLALTTGCSTVQKGAAVGGVAGAAVGGTWAHNSGILSTAEGACVGAAGGGLVGALIGDQLEDKAADNLEAEIENLQSQIATLEEALKKAEKQADKGGEKDQVITGLKRLTDKQIEELNNLKNQLTDKERELARIQGLAKQRERNLGELKEELDEIQVQLAQTPKGLTLTMVDKLLFQPGQAEITDEGMELLNNVASILQERFPGRELVFEGHTDNVPITRSGWESNWELGAARALAVLHFMTNQHGFDSKRLSATSYGEFRPVASNDTEEGRKQNRRTVIVVLPTVDIIHEPYAE